MTDKPSPGKGSLGEPLSTKEVGRQPLSADWLMRGVLARLGDAFDRITGREWTPSSSIATSELVERLKKLLDSEAKEVQGKGKVVPHNIKLKMQWDKFSTDSEETIERVQNELMVAAADYINDNLYYTLAPLRLELKSDYFTDGVKLYASFGEFKEDEGEAELDVTVPAFSLEEAGVRPDQMAIAPFQLEATFTASGKPVVRQLAVKPGKQISIGRMGGNDLMIDDASISKTHASLTVDDDGNVTVADTASTNGTFVNGQRIAYGKAVPVATGDKLKVGTVEVSLELTRQAVPVVEESDAPEQGVTSPDGLQVMIRSAPPTETEDDEKKTETPVAPQTEDQDDDKTATSIDSTEADDDKTQTSVDMKTAEIDVSEQAREPEKKLEDTSKPDE